MAFSTVKAKTTFTGFSDADKAIILGAMETAYNGSAKAKAMFDNFLATPGNDIDVVYGAGKFQGGDATHPAGTGYLLLDLNFIKDATYLSPTGKAVKDTAVTAIVHELGHALGGLFDDGDYVTDYKGANVNYVNPMYKELGLPEQISYIAYDTTGNILPLNYQFTNGATIDRAEAGDNDWNSSGAGNSRDLLVGGASANQLDSGAGDDFLAGRGGNDTLNGGAGRDTAIYFDTNPANYDIRKNADGSWSVRHVRGDGLDASKSDGNDSLLNIEQVQFGTNTYHLTKNALSFQTDFALVIDATGSMGDDIGAVRAQGAAIIDALFADGKTDARIGIVTFRDTTIGEPSQVVLPFTEQDSFADRKAAALSALNSISVYGGGDLPETADDGLRLALNGAMGEWRVGAAIHRIALFTDAEVKDVGLRAEVEALAANIGAVITSSLRTVGANGSVSTFTLAPASTGRAIGDDPFDGGLPPFTPSGDPVTPDNSGTTLQIFTILTGSGFGVDTSGLEDISSRTGGEFLTASDSDALVAKLLEIIKLPPDLTVVGTVGDDTALMGTDGNNTIQGLEGNDTIYGLAGNDILLGMGGNDLLIGGEGADQLDGGDGFDVASWLDQTGALTIYLPNQTHNAGTAKGEVVTNVEGFYLTNYSDSFTADDTGVFVYGFGGADIIKGSTGSDFIDGGAGADKINGWGGFDYLSYYTATSGITLDLKKPANNTGDAKGDVISNIEAYFLTSHNDIFVGKDTGQNIVAGYEGNDTMTGGFNANNWFFGGDGNDRMVGGGVSDLYVGGSGADTIVLASASPLQGSSVLDFQSGQDKIEISRDVFDLSSSYALKLGSTLRSGTAPTAATADPTFLYYEKSGILYFDPDGIGPQAPNILLQFADHPALAVSDFHLV